MPELRREIHVVPPNTTFTKEATASPFLIKPEMWHAVNVYVYNGTKLPEDMPYQDLRGTYALIREHTRTWRDVTFPETLTVADDIVDYANKAPRLYDALSKAGDQIMEAPDGSPEYEIAKKRFLAVLTRLIDDADKHAKNAASVKELVLKFGSQTADDHGSISNLKAKYEKDLGAGSEAEQRLAKKIADTQNLINQLNDEYNHDVVVASTTPTYAWIYPFGTIPAIVVAGVYGDRAVKALKAIHEAQDQLAQMQEERRKRQELLASITLCLNSVSGIEKLMGPAEQALGAISSTWSAIAGDLKILRNFVAAMKTGYDLYFVDVPQAVDDWKRIAVMADAYRANAFIKFEEQAAA